MLIFLIRLCINFVINFKLFLAFFFSFLQLDYCTHSEKKKVINYDLRSLRLAAAATAIIINGSKCLLFYF